MVRGEATFERERFVTAAPLVPLPAGFRLSVVGETTFSPALELELVPLRIGDRSASLLSPEDAIGLVARPKTCFAAEASRLERLTTGRMAGCSARRLT